MRAAIVLLAICAGATVARATVLVPAEFREVVNGSEIIAYGRVLDATPEWSDDRKHIDTVITFEVGTWLKGGPGETLTFKVPGGRIGRYRSITVGAPDFAIGDEAVLFLRSSGADAPFVFGFNQGVYRVRLDRGTSRRIVVPPALMAAGETPEVVVRGASARQSVPLETFGAQVQAVIAEAAARGAR
jgi:hypothetical protein